MGSSDRLWRRVPATSPGDEDIWIRVDPGGPNTSTMSSDQAARREEFYEHLKQQGKDALVHTANTTSIINWGDEPVADARRNVIQKEPEGTVEIVRTGEQVIIPESMSIREAMRWLERKETEEEREVSVRHPFVCAPLDGAAAFHAALAKIYGWVDLVPTPGWFPTPPAFISVKVGFDEERAVPWGACKLPNIEGILQTGMELEPTQKFFITGRVKQKHVKAVARIAQETKEILATKSIYKGKPVRISYDWQREHREFNLVDDSPQFFDVRGVDEQSLVFSRDVEQAIRLGLFVPIEHTEALRKNQVPLKRGVLFEGPFGVGKTLTAAITAKKCLRHGWTFVYVSNILDFPKAIEFARIYAPAVVLAEDIDRVMAGSNRSVYMDMILNTLDGVESKGQDIIVVVTTNDVDKINKAMIRPGRLDTLVSARPPDAEATIRLVRQYGRGLLSQDVNYAEIGDALAGNIPAVIREVVERAKLSAIDRVGVHIDGQIGTKDLLATFDMMRPHIALMNKQEKRGQGTSVTVVADQDRLLLDVSGGAGRLGRSPDEDDD